MLAGRRYCRCRTIDVCRSYSMRTRCRRRPSVTERRVPNLLLRGFLRVTDDEYIHRTLLRLQTEAELCLERGEQGWRNRRCICPSRGRRVRRAPRVRCEFDVKIERTLQSRPVADDTIHFGPVRKAASQCCHRYLLTG